MRPMALKPAANEGPVATDDDDLDVDAEVDRGVALVGVDAVAVGGEQKHLGQHDGHDVQGRTASQGDGPKLLTPTQAKPRHSSR